VFLVIFDSIQIDGQTNFCNDRESTALSRVVVQLFEVLAIRT